MGFFNIFNTTKKKSPDAFDRGLLHIFRILSHNDDAVMSKIRECLNDIPTYFALHQDAFGKRGIEYSFGGEKWIKFIAAVDIMKSCGYLAELEHKADAEAFKSALTDVLAANHIEFSLKNITFDTTKSIPDHAAYFNEYAGQSGITVMFIDIYSDDYVMCAASIADYAEVAEIASQIGISISSRPE